jgi:hypothetical protein
LEFLPDCLECLDTQCYSPWRFHGLDNLDDGLGDAGWVVGLVAGQLLERVKCLTDAGELVVCLGSRRLRMVREVGAHRAGFDERRSDAEVRHFLRQRFA